jgi:hypothetical protein
MNNGTLPLPNIGSGLRPSIDDWVHDQVWTELVAAFDGNPADLPTGTADRLEWLDAFSDRWDARAGKLERDQAPELGLSPEQVQVIDAARARLGMVTAQPPRFTDYDHVLALGGLIRACFVRPGYAAELLKSGRVASPSFVALGGHRPFSDVERQLAQDASRAELGSEFEALDAGVRAAFGVEEPIEVRDHQEDTPGGSWTLRRYAPRQGVSIAVAAAPSSEPLQRRANTPDSYVWFARDLAHLEPGMRILAVTTSIYVPAQHAAAVATLGIPFGVDVDTVGRSTDDMPAMWQQDFSPTRYLMEFRSAIRAMRRLLAATG